MTDHIVGNGHPEKPCRGCSGSGRCFPCEGFGAIDFYRDTHGMFGAPGKRYPAKRCRACQGIGLCIVCDGKGTVPWWK